MKWVLILDDSPLILEVARAALEQAGYGVLVAATLDELEHHRVHGRPDLVLLDVNMPEAFGDDVAAVLRTIRGLKVPILLFSNLDEDELARRAAEAGIDGFISKRAGIPAFVERVRALLAAP
ncbi:MAG TPA: response regulator [Polyangia bacterium]|nr:response regulator [Polyangia bacterium]